MNEDELIRNEDEMKRPSRVNTRDIRLREAQVSTDYGGKELEQCIDRLMMLVIVGSRACEHCLLYIIY